MNTKFAFKLNTKINKLGEWKTLYQCAYDLKHPRNFEQKYFKKSVESLFNYNDKDESTLVEKEYAFYLIYKYFDAYADQMEDGFYYDSRYSIQTCLNRLRRFYIDNDRLPNMDEFYEITNESNY